MRNPRRELRLLLLFGFLLFLPCCEASPPDLILQLSGMPERATDLIVTVYKERQHGRVRFFRDKSDRFLEAKESGEVSRRNPNTIVPKNLDLQIDLPEGTTGSIVIGVEVNGDSENQMPGDGKQDGPMLQAVACVPIVLSDADSALPVPVPLTMSTASVQCPQDAQD